MAVNYDRLNQIVRDKFGLAITYKPAGGNARSIEVIIEEKYVDATGGIGIQTASLVFQAVDADVPELAVGDAFTFNAVNYTVVEIHPDYYGMTEIIVNKA